MSVTYNIYNSTNILSKIATLQIRIDSNLEIATSRNGSITWNAASSSIVIPFVANLSIAELLALNTLIEIIIEETPLNSVYPSPRTMSTTKVPTLTNDELNGYPLGCIAVNQSSQRAHICVDNTIDAAVWIEESTTTNIGATGPTGATGVQGATGVTGPPTVQTLYFNSGGGLISNSFLMYGSQTSFENRAQIAVTRAGTMSNLVVVLSTPPGISESRTFTLRKNGQPTLLSVQLVDSTITGQDSNPLHNVSVSLYDLLSIQESDSGSAADAIGIVSVDINSSV